MMAQVVCRESMVTKNIFGACIYNTKIVPERQKMEERKEKIKQLFGLVDDYIEQAQQKIFGDTNRYRFVMKRDSGSVRYLFSKNGKGTIE